MNEKEQRLPKKSLPNPFPVRSYVADPFDLVEYLVDAEMEFYNSAKDTSPAAVDNVSGLVDYLLTGWKNGMPCSIKFASISFDFAGLGKKAELKKTGILYLRDIKTAFDFVNSGSENILIQRGTPVLELNVPTVVFPPDSREAVTAGMISRSFGMAADYMILQNSNPEFIIGLTYPRMGRLTRRWGFNIEEKPFPEEIYQTIDRALVDCEAYPEAIRDLTILRSQVLVYHTKDSFMQMTKPDQRLPRG